MKNSENKTKLQKETRLRIYSEKKKNSNEKMTKSNQRFIISFVFLVIYVFKKEKKTFWKEYLKVNQTKATRSICEKLVVCSNIVEVLLVSFVFV